MSFNFFMLCLSFTSAILFGFYSLTLLIKKNKLVISYYFAILFGVMAYEFFFYGIFFYGKSPVLDLLRETDTATVFLVGPCIYHYFSYITGDTRKSPSTFKKHATIFYFAIALTLAHNICKPSFVVAHVDTYLFSLNQSKNIFYSAQTTLAFLSLLFYLILTVKQIYYFFLEKKKSFELSFMLMLMLISLLGALPLNAGYILSCNFCIYLGMIVFSIIPFIYILFSIRHPEFTMQVIKESKKIHYAHNLKKSRNDALVLERLDELMRGEKLFKDADLSLASLSSLLMVSSHELSRLINTHYKQNFFHFVSIHRINEAKRLFLEKPDMSIIEVVFETGFGTKSSFYHNFTKVCKISPGEFKAKYSKKIVQTL